MLREARNEMGASIEVRQDAPGFKRLVLRRDDDGLVIDLVRDPAASTSPPVAFGLIVVDSLAEIMANKLTAIVGRAEERDLVDVMFLERDGGCTPATLAWRLSEVSVPDGIALPAGVAPGELRNYVRNLEDRMLVLAAPPAT